MQELPAEQAAQDLGGAVDYLLGHDAVTSSKVGVVGFCMGGGFVLLLAAQQGDKVGAAVPFYGVYDMADATDHKAVRRMRDLFLAPRVFFDDFERNPDPFEKASPILRVRKDAPPFYVIHGANDTLVAIGQVLTARVCRLTLTR